MKTCFRVTYILSLRVKRPLKLKKKNIHILSLPLSLSNASFAYDCFPLNVVMPCIEIPAESLRGFFTGSELSISRGSSRLMYSFDPRERPWRFSPYMLLPIVFERFFLKRTYHTTMIITRIITAATHTDTMMTTVSDFSGFFSSGGKCVVGFGAEIFRLAGSAVNVTPSNTRLKDPLEASVVS